MLKHKPFAIIVLLATMLFASSCSKQYIVTVPLEDQLMSSVEINLGEFSDGLPTDFEEGRKPTSQSMEKLRDCLKKEIGKRSNIQARFVQDDETNYQIRGTVIDYENGSGISRFVTGYLGAAHMIINLEFFDTKKQTVVFAGNFKAKVESMFERHDKMFDRIAKDFAKELESQIKKLPPTPKG